jgi:predicted ArsR family transcriptional regulator
MTTLQQQARALGDPTRHAIFRHIAEADGPVGVAELTEHFSFNHNAIRQHLAKLLSAGLVVESRAAGTGRGRPRLLYEVDPSSEGAWGTTGPYERLSRLLVEVIRTGRSPEEVGRRAADELRRASPSGDLLADVTAAMARQGFEPEVQATASGADVILHTCPFESSALTDRSTVCAIHLGLAEGLLADSGGSVEELVAKDPRRAGCVLRISLTDEDRSPSHHGKLTIKGKTARA